MAEMEKKVSQQVWSGYECPACFGVFRVPKGNEKREAICPRCESILRLTEGPAIAVIGVDPSATLIPGASPTAVGGPVTLAGGPVTLHPVEESEPADEEPAEKPPSRSGKGVRKRRKKLKSSLDPDWERTEHARKAKNDWMLPVFLIVGGLVVVGIVAATLKFVSTRDENGKEKPVPVKDPGFDLSDDPEMVVSLSPEFTTVDLEKEGEMILEQVRQFLLAKTMEEMLGMARPVERLEMKAKAHYSGDPYQPIEARSIGKDGSVSLLGEMVSVTVVLDDYSVRPVALEKVQGRYLVDWESWVGYSDMPWKRFLEIKPRRSKEFRVVISPVDYYNFDFSDDAAWRSFQISAPGHDAVVYGYVPRSSPMVEKLTPINPDAGPSAYVVKLRYPLESKMDNQVLIEKVVSSGWVLKDQPE